MSGEYVLVCYHSVEARFALSLAADLRNQGVPLWIDRLDIPPGADWLAALRQAMENASVFMPILSPDYVASGYGQRELQYATTIARPIIPILLRAVSAADWPLEVGYRQYVDFSDWRNEHNYEKKLEKLMAALGQHVAIKGFTNPEKRYLTQLAVRIAQQKMQLEFVRLSYQSRVSHELGEDVFRPQPNIEATWGLNGPFVLLDEQKYRLQQLEDFNQAQEMHPRLVLLGAGGVGKTTTLHRLALDMIQQRLDDPRKYPLPLLVDCTNWADDTAVQDFIRANWGFQSDPMPLLANGDVRLFMDNLDELGRGAVWKIQQLRDWLAQDQSVKYLVIASQSDWYTHDLNLGLPLVGLERMSESQARDFVLSYLGNESGSELLSRMFPPDNEFVASYWHKVVRNPLLMRGLMFVYQHSPQASLPDSIPAMMHQLIALNWEREQILQNPDWVPPEEMLFLLANLAFAMIEEDGAASFPIETALQYMGTSGLLQSLCFANILSQYQQRICFAHPMLRDIVAALRLEQSLHEKLTRPSFDESGKRIPTRWDVAVISLTALTQNPDAMIQNIAMVDPYLAFECLLSGQHISESAQKQVLIQLVYFAGLSSPEGLTFAGKQIKRLAGKQAITLLLELMRKENWELRLAAAKVLVAVNTSASQQLVDAFQNWNWNVDEGVVVALRRIGADAIPVLLTMLKDPDWCRRRGAAWALGRLGDRAAVPGLVDALHDEESLVRKEAATALKTMQDVEAAPVLLMALRDEDWRVRKSAADALVQLGTTSIPGLLRMLSDTRDDVRRIAIIVLGQLGDSIALPALLKALKESNPDIRGAAVHSLGLLKDQEAVPALSELVNDEALPRWINRSVGRLAIEALTSIGGEVALSIVHEWQAKQGERGVRKGTTGSAERAKSKLKRQKKLASQAHAKTDAQELIRSLKDDDWAVRQSAVEQLGGTGNEKALPFLLPMLKDTDEQVRLAVVRNLGNFPPHQVLESALIALQDRSDLVSDGAIQTLASLGSHAVPELLQLLHNESVDVRGRAVEALGKIGDAVAVPELTKLLYDMEIPRLEDSPICDIAARALKAIGTKDAHEALVHWRQDHDPVSKPNEPQVLPPVQLIPFDDPIQSYTAPLPMQPDLEDQKDAQIDTLLSLLEQLHDADWQTRQEAAKSLTQFARTLKGKSNQQILDQLTTALLDKEEFVRWTAVEALAWVGDASSLSSLLQMLKDPKMTVRVAAIRALSEIGDGAAVVGLTQSLGDEESMVREVAAEVLGKFGDKQAVPGLMQSLSDADGFVKRAAIEALGEIGSTDCVPRLLDILHGDDPQLRWAVIEALGKIGDEQSVPELVKYLNDTYSPPLADEYDEQQRLCDVVVVSLEQIGTADAINAVANWRSKKV